MSVVPSCFFTTSIQRESGKKRNSLITITMSKLTSLFAVLLLLFFTLSSAARREPTFVSDSAMKPALYEETEAEKNTEVVGESCEGAADKDDCLMRRTLAAHIDYIYTQKHKP